MIISFRLLIRLWSINILFFLTRRGVLYNVFNWYLYYLHYQTLEFTLRLNVLLIEKTSFNSRWFILKTIVSSIQQIYCNEKTNIACIAIMGLLQDKHILNCLYGECFAQKKIINIKWDADLWMLSCKFSVTSRYYSSLH